MPQVAGARLPKAQHLLSLSTADAARSIAEGEGQFDAAIAAPLAAERYGLRILATEVGDNPVGGHPVRARPPTRLRWRRRPAPTGRRVVAYIADDHPGALLELLTEFAVRGVNLTRIESRPTGERLGHYCFSIDCEGHVAEARLGEALSALHRICDEVRFCGSYPRADGKAHHPAQRARPTSPSRPRRSGWPPYAGRLDAVIDLKLLRDDPDLVRASQRARGESPSLVDDLLAADERRRAAVSAADNLRAESNVASKAIQSATKDERPAMIERAKELKDSVKEVEAEQAEAEAELRRLHLAIPNVVEEGAPAGGEDDYVVLEHVGEPPVFDFEPHGPPRGRPSGSAPSTWTAAPRSPARGSTT